MKKSLILGALAVAFGAGQLSATQITYAGTLTVDGTPGFGWVDGSDCGICGRGPLDGLQFWSFSSPTTQLVTITGTRQDVSLDLAFTVFQGPATFSTPVDDSGITSDGVMLNGQHLYWGGPSPLPGLTFQGYGDDQLPAPGNASCVLSMPFCDPQFTFLAQGGVVYTVVVSGGTGSDVGLLSPQFPPPFDSNYILAIASGGGNLTINPTPEPSTYWLLGTGLAGLAAAARRRKIS